MIDNILRFDRQTFCRAAKAKPKESLTGGVGDRKALINQSLNDAQSQIEQKSATSVLTDLRLHAMHPEDLNYWIATMFYE